MDPTVLAILALCLHLGDRRQQMRRHVLVMSAALLAMIIMNAPMNAALGVVTQGHGGADGGPSKRPRLVWSSRAHIEGHSYGMYERDVCGSWEMRLRSGDDNAESCLPPRPLLPPRPVA